MSLQEPEGKRKVSGLCRLVGISRQAFYKEQKERQRQAVDREAILIQVKIERRIHPRMGTRKLLHLIARELERMGIKIGRDRLFEILREAGLLIRPRRGRTGTTDSRHQMRVYANRVKGLEVHAPNEVWVCDITYIRTEEGFLYLCLITDAYSRKIVGYEINNSLEAVGCLRALEMALSDLPEGKHPIHHSDRGIQYCCSDYVKQLEERALPISMTEENHCYENAQAERVNGILKSEYGLDQTFRTKQQAIVAAQQAVAIYNGLRPHLSLNYRTPLSVHMEEAA